MTKQNWLVLGSCVCILLGATSYSFSKLENFITKESITLKAGNGVSVKKGGYYLFAAAESEYTVANLDSASVRILAVGSKENDVKIDNTDTSLEIIEDGYFDKALGVVRVLKDDEFCLDMSISGINFFLLPTVYQQKLLTTILMMIPVIFITIGLSLYSVRKTKIFTNAYKLLFKLVFGNKQQVKI